MNWIVLGLILIIISTSFIIKYKYLTKKFNINPVLVNIGLYTFLISTVILIFHKYFQMHLQSFSH